VNISRILFPCQVEKIVTLTLGLDMETPYVYLADFAAISSPSLSAIQAFFANLTTSGCNDTIAEAIILNKTLSDRLANLTAWFNKLKSDRAEIQSFIDAFWANLTAEIAQKDDPKALIQVYIKIMVFLERVRYLQRAWTWFNDQITSVTSLVQLSVSRITSLQAVLDISVQIDTTEASCSCGRAGATALVVTAATLTSPTFTAIEAYITAIQSYISITTTTVATDAAAFADTTAQDLIDLADIDICYIFWARLEWGDYCSYNESKTVIKAIIADTVRSAQIKARIASFLNGVNTIVSGSDSISCSENTTNNIVTCTYSGTLSGSGDLTIAANNLVSFAKVVVVAFTGSVYIDVKLVSVDTTSGDFSITIVLTKVKIDILLEAYYDTKVRVANVISAIQTRAQIDQANYIAQLSLDATTAFKYAAAQYQASATLVVIDAQNTNGAFDTRVVASAAYVSSQASNVAAIQVSTSVRIWSYIFNVWNASYTKLVQDRQCCVNQLAKDAHQADVDVWDAIMDQQRCNSDTQNNPSSDQQTYNATAWAALQAQINQAFITRAQVYVCRDAMNDTWQAFLQNYTKNYQDITTKVSNLNNGIENTVSQAITYLNQYSDMITAQITVALQGCYETIISVSVTILTIDTTSTYVRLQITIVDTGIQDETFEDMVTRHCNALNATMPMASQVNDWNIVYSGTSEVSKRTTTGNTYTATAGTGAPPAPTTTSGGVTTTTSGGVTTGSPAPVGSSGYTLVFSLVWAIVVSLFVLF
jgi:hypothetical protein